MNLRFLVAAALAVLLAACASAPRRVVAPLDPAMAEARQQAREADLRARQDWGLSGRIAVTAGREGGSGRIEWAQHGPRFTVELSAPVTRQSWRLTGMPGEARLDGLEGGPRVGADAVEVLYAATGWILPVASMADWVRGVRAEGMGPADLAYGADGRLERLRQGGWQVEYRWPDTPAEAGGVQMPERVDARLEARDDGREARVKLVVDRWQEQAEAGGG